MRFLLFYCVCLCVFLCVCVNTWYTCVRSSFVSFSGLFLSHPRFPCSGCFVYFFVPSDRLAGAGAESATGEGGVGAHPSGNRENAGLAARCQGKG